MRRCANDDSEDDRTVQFSSIPQSCPTLCDPMNRQASLSITNSQSSLKFTSIESVMPSSHLILCRPLLLLPSIFPIIRVFSNESVLHYLHHSLASGQITGREHSPTHQQKIKDLLNMTLPIRTRLSFPFSQSLPSGSFHKPLIFLHQRAERLKTTITGN